MKTTLLTTYIILIFAHFTVSAEQDFLKKISLDNGMGVILFPHEDYDKEIRFQLIAKSGFAVLPEKKQKEGKLAAEIIWELGLGKYSAEEITLKLYQANSELNLISHPLYREIEGTTDEMGLKDLLDIIKMIFTEPKLSDNDLQNGLKSLKIGFKSQASNPMTSLDIETKLLNSGNWPPFLPISLTDLDNVDLEGVRDYYKAAFQNPADYCFILVGDFKPIQALSLIQDTLGKIPQKPPSLLFSSKPELPLFLPSKKVGFEEKNIAYFNSGREGSVTRMTYPLNINVTETTIDELDFLSQLIHLYLKNSVASLESAKYGPRNGVNVSYEFPYYPNLTQTWLTLTLYSDPATVESLPKKVQESMRALLQSGPTELLIREAKNQINSNDLYWRNENDYWLSKMSHLCLWGWDLNELQKSPQSINLSEAEAKQKLNQLIDLEHYTLIRAKR